MIEFPRPSLPPKVASSVFVEDSLAVCEWCSPKSFRVEAGLAWLTEQAAKGNSNQHFWWIGKGFGEAAAAFSLLKSSLTPGSFTVPSRASALVLINGATIVFKSGEVATTLYADNVHAAVMDLAIHIPEKSYEALSETLANTHGKARILSTVAENSNWFHQLARRVETDLALGTYSRFTAFDAREYGLIGDDSIEHARATLPDHLFRALYLADPYDDRVESAYRAGDPRLMSDAELAIIASLDPLSLSSISDEELQQLAAA